MNTEYSILFQKEGFANPVKDLQDDFKFVCTSIDDGSLEAKELEKNNWKEEDGEDVYIPEDILLMGMDITIGMIYVGQPSSYRERLDYLIEYLTTDLGETGLMLFSRFHNRGYRYCVFKSISEQTLFKGSTEECYECKLTMRSEDPRTRIKAYTNLERGVYLSEDTTTNNDLDAGTSTGGGSGVLEDVIAGPGIVIKGNMISVDTQTVASNNSVTAAMSAAMIAQNSVKSIESVVNESNAKVTEAITKVDEVKTVAENNAVEIQNIWTTINSTLNTLKTI